MVRVHHHSVEEVTQPITTLPDAVHHRPIDEVTIPITTLPDMMHQHPMEEVIKTFSCPDSFCPTISPCMSSTAVIGGGIVGALLAGILVALLVHRIRKKDSGSYGLEPKGVKTNGDYQMAPTQEIYA
uniref:Syndecan/Neurexin domain-containing protein n=1 Tax=Eptatretus burgeri TaxID=7764 RepID=A0A8C4NCQ2_EPTBU